MREIGEVRVHQDGETTVLAPGMNTRLFREGELFYERLGSPRRHGPWQASFMAEGGGIMKPRRSASQSYAARAARGRPLVSRLVADNPGEFSAEVGL